MSELNLETMRGLLEKLAAEVVFAEAGKDNGLLPINSLLRQIEELSGNPDAPGPLVSAVAVARRWIDGVLDTTALFNAEVLQQLNRWTDWMQSAMRSLEQKTPLPGLPGDWAAGGTIPSPAPVTPAAPPAAPAATAMPAAVADPAAACEEPTITLNVESDGDLLREFISESGEHLQNIEQGVLVLEDNPTDADTLNTIFRAFHTFKGGSGFLQLIAIQTLAHQLESLLDQMRQHKLEITPDVINLILEGGDTLKQFVTEIDGQLSGSKPRGPILVPTLGLLARIRAVLQGESAPAAAVVAAPAPAPVVAKAAPAPAPPTAAPKVEPAAPQPAAAPVAAPPVASPTPAPFTSIPAPAPAPTTASTSAPAAAPASASTAPRAPGDGAAKGSVSASFVKVDTFKLDSLVDLVGELVIGQSLVVQNRALVAVQDQQLNRDLAQLGRITKELQRTAMSLRMVPIRATFQKMNRLVRDTAARIGKQVELLMDGEETELDRTIIEELSDPLVHMIRNAMDHGIEMPKVRQERGKSPQGTVWLKAFYRGGNIVIEIKDDGNGLDKTKLLAKAVEKGMVKADASLSESEIFGLIFAPGFSTAEKVTDLSGRGVGMDVVRRNLEKLRGKVDIQSTLGQGSTFSISLPLTLAIIDGLIVGIGEHRYILPTLSVSESFRPTSGMISSVYGRGEMVNVRGRLQPVLRLYEHLGIEPASKDPTQSIAVVVEAGKDTRCVLVDQLLGKQEVVIKSLGETLKKCRALAGAAILGDGRVGLILDPHALVGLTSDVVAHAA